MSNLTIAVFFTKNTGEPATGLVLTELDLYLTAQNKSTGVDTAIWNGSQNPTEEINNVGAYTRIYADADLDTHDYFARGSYTGGTTLDTNHVQGSYSEVTAASIADSVWDEMYPQHDLTNSFGERLGEVGAVVWTAANRRLTEGTVPPYPVVSGNKITVYRGTTWAIPIEELGEIDIDGGDILYFTVKAKKTDADESARLQVRVGGADPGLIYFDGAAATRSNGSIEILDATVGNVVIRVNESLTVDAVPHSLRVSSLHYDFKHIKGGVAEVKAPGIFVIEADVTRAIK